MNRKIKFRVWDTVTKRMLSDFNLFGEVTCFDLVRQWLMEFPDGRGSLERMNDIETMQFTGLRDKNGKEIYEGDIISISDNDPTSTGGWSLMVVEFHGSAWCYRDTLNNKIDDVFSLIGDSNQDDEAVVIGNIFENADLVTSKDIPV